MKNKNTIFCCLIIFCCHCQAILAQPGVSPYYKAPESMAGKTVIIPAGTTFEGRIESTIGSTVSKQGQSFIISLSSPVLANGSDVLIPAGAQVLGEVVQAIPASNVPHAKHEKPPGQLRVQITALKMPDGTTYPMVASITGEEIVDNNPYGGFNSYNKSSSRTLGSGVAYVGSEPGFSSVSAGRARSNRVVTKQELLNDPIMGREHDMDTEGKSAIRSLVKKNRNLYIYAGSPLTIRLEAPFKIGMNTSAGEASTLELQPRGNAIRPSVQTTPPVNQARPIQESPGRYNTNPVSIPNRTNNQDSNF